MFIGFWRKDMVTIHILNLCWKIELILYYTIHGILFLETWLKKHFRSRIALKMPLSFINTFIILDHKKVMIDSFYIGAYWTNRKEKLESIVNKTVSFLGELAISDEQFFDWYELG